jgi:small-conductance mechanosensitive channel
MERDLLTFVRCGFFIILDDQVRIGDRARSKGVEGTVEEINPRTTLRLVLGALEILGVQSLADGFATVRVKFRTLPLNEGKVANELRRRIMTAFVARGIRPYTG